MSYAAPRPPASPHYTAGTPTAPVTARTITGPAVMTGIGSLLLIGGAFLPWVKLNAIITTVEVSGVDGDQGDGWITLPMGALALVAMFFGSRILRAAIALAAGGFAAWVSWSDLVEVRDNIDKLKQSTAGTKVSAVVGIGLWATVIGAAVVVVGAVLTLAERD